MRCLRLAHCLLSPALLLAVAPGCQVLHPYRPFLVQAKDADTGRPIPAARVRIAYPLLQSTFAPSELIGTAGDDGTARLRAAPYRDAGVTVEVAAQDYLSEERFVPPAEVEALKPAGLFESVDRRPPTLVIQLYAEPRPTVELVLPAGYRGTVKADVQVQDDAPCPPGQRRFTVAVPPSGVVQVSGPGLLRHVFAPDFSLRYADGAALSPNAKDAEVGYWWLKYEGGVHHFLVGTRADYERTRPAAREPQGGAGERGSSGRRQGRGGRRGRRGDPPSG